MTSAFTRRRFLLGTAALSSTVAFGACSGEAGPTTEEPAEQLDQAQIDEAMNTETELTFWTWVPNIQNQVDMFEQKYPKVKVKLVNVGQGAPHYTKLRAAIQSGKGAPDVVQMEFQYIDSFIFGDNLLDMAPNGATDLQDKFPDWVWSQVAKEGRVYGIPQDTGPMGLLYRNDLLEDAGIEPPKTWEDFAAAADKYRTANPKSYLTNLAPATASHFISYLWQAGIRPFAFDGEQTVKVDIASEEAK